MSRPRPPAATSTARSPPGEGWLVRYTLTSPERAAQRVRFFDTYRSYVISYNLGRDLVRSYIEKKAGGDAEKRWQEFERLLSSPRLPSDLAP